MTRRIRYPSSVRRRGRVTSPSPAADREAHHGRTAIGVRVSAAIAVTIGAVVAAIIGWGDAPSGPQPRPNPGPAQALRYPQPPRQPGYPHPRFQPTLPQPPRQPPPQPAPQPGRPHPGRPKPGRPQPLRHPNPGPPPQPPCQAAATMPEFETSDTAIAGGLTIGVAAWTVGDSASAPTPIVAPEIV